MHVLAVHLITVEEAVSGDGWPCLNENIIKLKPVF